MPRNGLSRRAFLGFLPVCAALSACTAQNTSLGFDADGRLQVVATTPILADVARAVGGERARVHALIPNGADPHSYEPSLRDVRDVAYARLAFTNGLLLEQRKMVAMVSSNLPQGSVQVAVAERGCALRAPSLRAHPPPIPLSRPQIRMLRSRFRLPV